MTQDFRSSKLQKRSFRNQNLTGADFSHADIRGADFSEAILVGANFTNALAGLPPTLKWRFVVHFLFNTFCLGLVFSIGINSFDFYKLDSEILINNIAMPCATICIGLGVLFILKSRERLTAIVITGVMVLASAAAVAGSWLLAGPTIVPMIAAGVTLALVVALGYAYSSKDWTPPSVEQSRSLVSLFYSRSRPFLVALLVAFFISIVIFAMVAGILKLVGETGFMAVFNLLSVFTPALMPYWCIFFAVNAVLALTQAFDTLSRWWLWGGTFTLVVVLSIPRFLFVTQSRDFGVLSATATMIIWMTGIVFAITIGFYTTRRVVIGNRSLGDLEKVIVILPVDGTCFQHANLTNATFTGATLKNTNFQEANLTDACLEGCHQLNSTAFEKSTRPLRLIQEKTLSLEVFVLIVTMFMLSVYILGYFHYSRNEPVDIITELRSNYFLQKILFTESSPFIGNQDFTSLAFSSDGQQLAGGSEGKTHLWNLKTGKLIRTFGQEKNQPPNSKHISISPDKQTLVNFTNDGFIKLWNLKTGQLSHTVTKFRNEELLKLKHGYDREYSLTSKNKPRSFDEYAQGWPLDRYLISADGTTAATFDNTHLNDDKDKIKLWNVNTGKLLRTISPDQSPVEYLGNILGLSANGQFLASDGMPKRSHNTPDFDDTNWIMLWDVKTGRLTNTISYNSDLNCSVDQRPIEISPDGKTLVVFCTEKDFNSFKNTITVWNLKTRQPPRTLSEHYQITATAMSPDRQLFAFVSEDYDRKISSLEYKYTIEIWNLHTGQKLHTFYRNKRATSIAISPNSQLLASGGDGTVELWQLTKQ